MARIDAPSTPLEKSLFDQLVKAKGQLRAARADLRAADAALEDRWDEVGIKSVEVCTNCTSRASEVATKSEVLAALAGASSAALSDAAVAELGRLYGSSRDESFRDACEATAARLGVRLPRNPTPRIVSGGLPSLGRRS